jgi:hypothetical protein
LRAVVLACVVVLALPAAAAAEDAPFIAWNPLLPSAATTFTPSRETDCVDGNPTCVDRTLAEMYRRFYRLYASCDHNAVFSLTYIRVTEMYKRADRAGFFEEPRFVAHEDAVFARMYLEPFDHWAAGRREHVPLAWRIALDAGRGRSVRGLGNILHGINAHVNRDMPFMLAALGLVQPNGRSRKPDHDRVNQLLNQVYDDVIEEMATRFDPSTRDYDVPGTTLDNAVTFQLLPSWREAAWRHAEMLSRAQTAQDRQLVAEYIERYAVEQANMISGWFGYRRELGESSAARDAHCARYLRDHPIPANASRGAGRPAGRPRLALSRRGLRATRRGRVPVRLTCPRRGPACSGIASVDRRVRRIPLASARFFVPRGRQRTVWLRLRPSARTALRRRGSISVLVVVRTDGRPGSLRRSTTLRPAA